MSFPPPLVIRSFHSSILRPKRPRHLAKRQVVPVTAPPSPPRDLENKVGSLTMQVSEMIDLMKTLVSQRPPSVSAAEVVNYLELAGPLPSGDSKVLTPAKSDLPHAPCLPILWLLGTRVLPKTTKVGGSGSVNPAPLITPCRPSPVKYVVDLGR